MLSKLFANKKLVVIVVILFLILCIGIWLIGTSDTKRTDNKGNNNGLEILNPDEEMTDNTTDASEAWDDTKAPDVEPSDETNDTDKQGHEEEHTESNESDDSEEKEDILEDDVIWGEIY